MSTGSSMSPEEQASIVTRIGELERVISNQQQELNARQQQIPGARGKKQQQLREEIANIQQSIDSQAQEANTLRARIGMPMVIPSSSPPPMAPVAAAPVKKKRGFMRGCLIGVAALIGIVVLYNVLNPGNSTPSATTTGGASSADTNAPAAAVHTVGQDVQVGDVRWKVLEAKDEGPELKSDNDLMEPKKTAGKWIRLRVEIENQSKDPLSFTGVDLVDGQDRTFRSSAEGFMYMPTEEACSLKQLSANVPQTCQMLFEVPGDAADLHAVVGDLQPFGADDQKIALGF